MGDPLIVPELLDVGSGYDRLLVGIDGGASTGICLYDPKRRNIVSLRTLTFWSTYYAFSFLHVSYRDRVKILVEDPKQIKAIFSQNRYRERYLNAEKRSSQEKIAFQIGEACRESELLIHGLRNLGYIVIAARPTGAKWDAGQFKKVTKYQSSTNQHVRDAALLVYGLTWEGVR